MANVTKADLEKALAKAHEELAEAKTSVKAWYKANPVALVIVLVIGVAIGHFLF